MIRTVIVEDEMLVRIGLQTCVNWKMLGYEIVGEARDGEEGLKLIKEVRPDFALIDIKMPNIDGIEMINRVKKLGINTQFVILSGHDDFEYVKNAMKLGALEYILKLSFNIMDLEKLLIGLKDKVLTGEDSSKYDLSIGLLPEDNLPADVIDKAYFIASIHCDEKCIVKEQQQVVSNAVYQVVKQQFYFSQHIDEKQRFAFILIQKDESEVSIENLRNVGYRILQAVSLCVNGSICVGLSHCYAAWSLLQSATENADEMAEYGFYNPRKVHMDIPEEHKAGRIPDVPDLKETIKMVSHTGNYEFLYETLQDFFQMCAKEYVSPKELKVYLVGVVGALIYEFDIDNQMDIYAEIQNSNSFEEMCDNFFEFYNNFSRRIPPKNRSEYIILAKEKVQQNYQNPDFSLHTLCTQLNLTESYFCKLMKKEMGVTFVTYLNMFRINKAIEFMSLNHTSVIEASRKSGFNNLSYFCRTFKKILGKRPGEFR